MQTFITFRKCPAHLSQSLKASFNFLLGTRLPCEEHTGIEATISAKRCIEFKRTTCKKPVDDLNNEVSITLASIVRMGMELRNMSKTG